jgi:hypothetical protein
MANKLIFRAWSRPGISGLVTGAEQGRAVAKTTLVLHEVLADGSEDTKTAEVSFLLAGPRDVGGLQRGAILHRYPERGVLDAEMTMQPYAEFADPGLPWRYTPAANPEAATIPPLRPWLVLIVGTPEEITVRGDQVELDFAVRDAHPLEDSARHSHIQTADDTTVSRVLSARKLEANTDYIAALVPAYGEAGQLDDAWRGADPLTVPCYDHWRFRTGAEGDFRSLALRLSPQASVELGQAPVAYARLDDEPDLRIRGALAPLGSDDTPVADEIREDLSGLRTPAFDDEAVDGDGRPVVGLPRYGALWTDARGFTLEDTIWGETLNGDPRHRGIAGLGARLAFDAQDTLAEEVGRQAGALDAADQSVRHLACGLAVSTSLWERRLPADPAAQLALFGPALRRVMTDSGSLAARVTGPERPLDTGWFSTAARRALRRGPARTALARPEASDPTFLLAAANRCPDPQPFAEVGVPNFEALGVTDWDSAVLYQVLLLRRPPIVPNDDTADGPVRPPRLPGDPWSKIEQQLPPLLTALVESGADDKLVTELSRRMKHRADAVEPLPVTALALLAISVKSMSQDPQSIDMLEEQINGLIDNVAEKADHPESLAQLLEGLVPQQPEPALCEPLRPDQLEALAEAARAAFDPSHADGLARRIVLGGITGLDPEQPLTPPEFCPSLDLPVWDLLAEHQPDWLLPGLGTTPEDSVLAVQTNAVFTEALLTGFNTELLGQLRWRNLRIASRCTPVRTFWNRVDPTGDDDGPTRLNDITSITAWTPSSDLGGDQHRPPELSGSDLVVVIRGQLLQRYPQTLVYLVAEGDAEKVVWPTFRGRLGVDATYLGFPGLSVPADLDDRLLVFEEPPSGFRFRNGENVSDDIKDGANYAIRTFAPPVRVLISASELIPRDGDL